MWQTDGRRAGACDARGAPAASHGGGSLLVDRCSMTPPKSAGQGPYGLRGALRRLLERPLLPLDRRRGSRPCAGARAPWPRAPCAARDRRARQCRRWHLSPEPGSGSRLASGGMTSGARSASLGSACALPGRRGLIAHHVEHLAVELDAVGAARQQQRDAAARPASRRAKLPSAIAPCVPRASRPSGRAPASPPCDPVRYIAFEASLRLGPNES